MESISYHLAELEIIRTPRDPRRAAPRLLQGESRILDVGCGIGQTLLAEELQDADQRCGVDPDCGAVEYGKTHFPFLDLRVASAEKLPFPDDHFDLVFSRVALPYSNLPAALKEICRVLRPSGRIWAMMHPWSLEKERLRHRLRTCSLKLLVDSAYVVVNSGLVSCLGVSIARPWSSKHESFQTSRAMPRLFRRAGLVLAPETDPSRFVFEGFKPTYPGPKNGSALSQ